MAVTSKQKIGAKGERKAVRYLKRQGYKIVERDLMTPFCEVDIVAVKGDKLAFIEVKTRTSDLFGTPQEAVDRTRQSRYRRAAAYYTVNASEEYIILFDVIEVYPNNKWHINHIENAY